MLKQLSLIFMLSPLLVACGGGGGVDKVVIPPKSSSSSSVPVSSSSEPASSSSSSSSEAPVIDVDMTTWRGNNGGEVALNNEGVMFTATADGQGAVFDLAGVNLKDAVIDFVVNVSSEYTLSGANLQPFAQVKTTDYPGEYDCWINNGELTAGADQTVSCTVDEDAFDQTANDVQVGIQAKGTTIAGTILIKSVKVKLASGQVVASSSAASTSSASSTSSVSSSAPVVYTPEMTTGSGGAWRNNNGGTLMAGPGSALTLGITASGQGAVFDLGTPFNLEGATLTVTYNVTDITAGAIVQLYGQSKGDTYPGQWCNAPAVAVGTDQTATCALTDAQGRFTASDSSVYSGFQLGLQVFNSTAVTATVVIKSATITYP